MEFALIAQEGRQALQRRHFLVASTVLHYSQSRRLGEPTALLPRIVVKNLIEHQLILADHHSHANIQRYTAME